MHIHIYIYIFTVVRQNVLLLHGCPAFLHASRVPKRVGLCMADAKKSTMANIVNKRTGKAVATICGAAASLRFTKIN